MGTPDSASQKATEAAQKARETGGKAGETAQKVGETGNWRSCERRQEISTGEDRWHCGGRTEGLEGAAGRFCLAKGALVVLAPSPQVPPDCCNCLDQKACAKVAQPSSTGSCVRNT